MFEVEPCVDVLSSYNQGLCFLFVVLTMSSNVLGVLVACYYKCFFYVIAKSMRRVDFKMVL
jgi:hypothetical protein